MFGSGGNMRLTDKEICMNKHTRAAQKEWINGDNWEDERAEEFNMTMNVIAALCVVAFWAFYLLPAIADWASGI